MPTKAEVVLAAHDAVQAELRFKRAKATPWPDRILGPDDGHGYNFSNSSLRPFTKGCYGRMKDDPVLVGVSDRFSLPSRLPIASLLEKKVSDLEIFIASDVCKQLGL